MLVTASRNSSERVSRAKPGAPSKVVPDAVGSVTIGPVTAWRGAARTREVLNLLMWSSPGHGEGGRRRGTAEVRVGHGKGALPLSYPARRDRSGSRTRDHPINSGSNREPTHRPSTSSPTRDQKSAGGFGFF